MENNGRYWLQTLALFLIAFILGSNEFIMVGITSDVAQTYQTSLTSVGILITAFAITYVLTTPIVTSVTGRHSRYYSLLILLIVFGAANILTALAPSLEWLFAARILTASVAGAIISLATVFASQIAPASKQGLTIAIVSAGYSVATILGVPIGTAIATRLSWRDSFGLIAIITLFVIIMAAALLPRQTAVNSHHQEPQFRLLTDGRILAGASLILFITAAQYTFYTYIRPLLTQVLHFSTFQLNWLLALLGVCFIVGDICSGLLANHQRSINFLPIMMIGIVADLLIMSPSFNHPASGLLSLCGYCFLFALPQALLNLFFINTAEKSYPNAVDLAASLNPIFTNIGIALGSSTASFGIKLLPLSKISNADIIYGFLALAAAIILKQKSGIKKNAAA